MMQIHRGVPIIFAIYYFFLLFKKLIYFSPLRLPEILYNSQEGSMGAIKITFFMLERDCLIIILG